MIKVLVVEDSPVVQELLVHILNSDPAIRVIGVAGDGDEAIEFVSRNKPDVITMDINMSRMNGIEATRRIMETRPVPIVIVSGVWNPREVETTFLAMEAGALAVVEKPQGIGHPDHPARARDMIEKVKLMSEVKLVRRWALPPETMRRDGAPACLRTDPQLPVSIKVVAVGASTGGPPVLHGILSGLPQDFPAPLMIVQHIAKGFLKGLVDWISEASRLTVRIAEDGETPLPGCAYFAPDGLNMGVGRTGRIRLEAGDGDAPRPSVSYLFRSVASAYGRDAVGVLLTGMGADGARELKLMRDSGAITIVQDRESSAVYGMPGVALELNAASYVFPPEKIVSALKTMTKKTGDK